MQEKHRKLLLPCIVIYHLYLALSLTVIDSESFHIISQNTQKSCLKEANFEIAPRPMQLSLLPFDFAVKKESSTTVRRSRNQSLAAFSL